MKKKEQVVRKPNYSKKQSYKLALCVLPGVLYIALFNYIPLWGLGYAFVEYKPGRMVWECEWIGLKYFTYLFGNPIMRSHLWQVLRNVFVMNIIGYVLGPLTIIFSLFLADVKNAKFKKVVQTLTTMPHFIGWVVVYSLMLTLFGSNGFINRMCNDLGIYSHQINYMIQSGPIVYLNLELLDIWKGMGWGAVLYLATISTIDTELYDAARVDGATKVQRMWYITWPHLTLVYVTSLIMSIGQFLNTGTEKYLMFTNAMNRDLVETLDLYVYTLGIVNAQYSFSTAVGIMKSGVAFVLFGIANSVAKAVRGNTIF